MKFYSPYLTQGISLRGIKYLSEACRDVDSMGHVGVDCMQCISSQLIC